MKGLFALGYIIVTALLFPSPSLPMARHALRTVEFKFYPRPLHQDPDRIPR